MVNYTNMTYDLLFSIPTYCVYPNYNMLLLFNVIISVILIRDINLWLLKKINPSKPEFRHVLSSKFLLKLSLLGNLFLFLFNTFI